MSDEYVVGSVVFGPNVITSKHTGAVQPPYTGAATATTVGHACMCVGPQRGEPLCPCQMRGVIVRDGRYIKPEQDLGPVAP